MMIPKIIHYCWFGGNPLPKSARKCIDSWKKYCSDYRIVEWNEDNFDLDLYPFARGAYDSKKYAFVTDIVRLYAIYHSGGIYMDTDVELVKPLDAFLDCNGFTGFETKDAMVTGIMAGQKGLPLFGELLSYYDGRHFLDKEGKADITTNTLIITDALKKNGFLPNGSFQSIDGFCLYPADYFCPLNNATGVLHKTKNTAAIHWFNKSWISKVQRIRSRITRIFHRWFGEDVFRALRRKGKS